MTSNLEGIKEIEWFDYNPPNMYMAKTTKSKLKKKKASWGTYLVP